MSIPITNNVRVEEDENFDVILQSNSSGLIIDSPKQTTVTIIDDDGNIFHSVDNYCLDVLYSSY